MRVTVRNGDAEVTIETDMIVHDAQVLTDMATEAVRIYTESFPDEAEPTEAGPLI